MKNRALLSAGLCAALLFSACSAQSESASSEAESAASAEAASESEATSEAAAADETEYPITITHAFGETVIESKPERIVTIAWENQDTPLALGVAPVGVSAANYGLVTENNLHPWTDEAFAALGVTEPNVFDDTDGWDYEAISDAQPDVILAAYSGLTQEEYDTLSQIAPVVAYAEKAWQTGWREQTIENATGMGMKAEGEALVAETEALIAERVAEYSNLAGVKAAFCWVSADDMSTFYVYLPTDPRAAYLTDLGLEFPESVMAMAESSEDFSVTVSRENADQLCDVDLMVVYGDQALLDAMQADELMSQIPAVSNGAVALIDSTSALAGSATCSILSIPYTIDDYLTLLSDAAANIPA